MSLINWPLKQPIFYLICLVHLFGVITSVMPERNYLFSVVENFFPYKHLCFASTLSHNLLITSADCVFRRSPKLIAVKFNYDSRVPGHSNDPNGSRSDNSVSTERKRSQRFTIRTVHVHRNYNCSVPANDNIALIRIENTNRKFTNKLYDRSANREPSVEEYQRNVLKTTLIFENWKDLTNYILVEQTVGFVDYERCLSGWVSEPWYGSGELSKNSICTAFYSDKIGGANSQSSIIINWNQQLGAPLIMLGPNGAQFVGILIRIDGANRKPLIFLRLSLYFDWIQKFLR